MGADLIYFDRLENRYYIKGRLLSLEPLHLGSGLGDDESDARVMKADGKPFIPGSSLKGLIRSNLERLINTLSTQEGFDYQSCLLDKKYAPLDLECATVDGDLKRELLKQKKRDKATYFKNLEQKLCAVCQLFGSTEMAAKIKFSDSFLIGDYKASIRDGIAIDRERGTTKKGAKYDYEVVEKGAEFSFELVAENLKEGELGLLGLGLLDLLNAKAVIGGNTSRGLGKVKLELDELEYFADSKGLVEYLTNSRLQSKSNGEEFLRSQIEQLLSEVG